MAKKRKKKTKGDKAVKQQTKKPRFAGLRNYFLTGLLVAVPLWVTYRVLVFLIDFADKGIAVIPRDFRDAYPFIFNIPGLGTIITLSLVMLVGFFARNFFGRKLVQLGESIIEKIPLIRSVYSATKQLLETVFAGSGDHFERVVLVEYPRHGIYSLGFVTGSASAYSKELIPQKCLNIFIPTTPNPTSGWYILIPEKDVRVLNINVEQAFKIIISAGMVMPKTEVTFNENEVRVPLRKLENKDESQ